MSQEPAQGQIIKIQNKIANFLETNTHFSERRSQFILLNKQYRGLSKEERPQDVQQTVEKVMIDHKGAEVKFTQLVKKRTFPNAQVETLYNELKQKRKQILRFNKQATLYINMLCERIIEDFISSCEPLYKNKKTQEKTFGWKQFNKQKFENSFTSFLVRSSKYFNDFLAVKQLIHQFKYDKEILRISNNMTKAESTTVYQDLQRFKFLKNKQYVDQPEEFKKQVDDEFGSTWASHLGNLHDILEHLQSDDENSKFLFNNVKNVTRQYQDVTKPTKDTDIKTEEIKTDSNADTLEPTEQTDDSVKKIKISNGFKNMIAKIIKEMLTNLSYKIQIYLDGQPNHQVKLTDIQKIIKISSSIDSIDEMKKQFEEFDKTVSDKIQEIETLKAAQKNKLVEEKKSTEKTDK